MEGYFARGIVANGCSVKVSTRVSKTWGFWYSRSLDDKKKEKFYRLWNKNIHVVLNRRCFCAKWFVAIKKNKTDWRLILGGYCNWQSWQRRGHFSYVNDERLADGTHRDLLRQMRVPHGVSCWRASWGLPSGEENVQNRKYYLSYYNKEKLQLHLFSRLAWKWRKMLTSKYLSYSPT